MIVESWIDNIPPDQPVLIAGPTASGKSALAIYIAETAGGIIINADALQVFSNWRLLSARPSVAEESRTKHFLYGHVDGQTNYSVGHWLRDIAPYLLRQERAIIVGGTGLYFSALTKGLVDIPNIPQKIKNLSETRWKAEGLQVLIDELDEETSDRIDIQNPMRVIRAWQVAQYTGKSIIAWQRETPVPLLDRQSCTAIIFSSPTEWLNRRIAERFERMITLGALEEAQENLHLLPQRAPSLKAIGATELMAYIKGELSLAAASEKATLATRQYAKRQRTWFRSNMKDWNKFDPSCGT